MKTDESFCVGDFCFFVMLFEFTDTKECFSWGNSLGGDVYKKPPFLIFVLPLPLT